MNNKGFSLVELLIAVSILGILSAIAIPAYQGIQKRGYRAEAKANLMALRMCQEKHYAESNEYVDGANTNILMAELSDFRPGEESSLSYNYGASDFVHSMVAYAMPRYGRDDHYLCTDSDGARGLCKSLANAMNCSCENSW